MNVRQAGGRAVGWHIYGERGGYFIVCVCMFVYLILCVRVYNVVYEYMQRDNTIKWFTLEMSE